MLKKIEKSEERSGGRKKIKTLKKRENHDDLTLSFILDLLRGRLRGPPEDTVARRKASLERRAGSASGQAAKGGVVKCWERRRCIIDSVCLWPRRGRAAAVPRSHALRAYARGCPAAGKGDEKRVEKRNRSKKSKFPPCFGPAPRSISLNLLDLFSLSLSLKKKKKKKAPAHPKSRDLSLLGVYAANELLGDDRLKPAARAAAEAVARGSGSVGGSGGGGSGGNGNGNGASFGCALLVNNGALASFSEGKADPEAGDVLSLWLRKSNDCKGAGGGGWERVSPPPPSSPSSSSSSSPALLLRGAGGEERAKLFAQAVASGLVDRVSDFDDHLLDLKKDWLNPGLLA